MKMSSHQNFVTSDIVCALFGFPTKFLDYLEYERGLKSVPVLWHVHHCEENTQALLLYDLEEINAILAREVAAHSRWVAGLQREYKAKIAKENSLAARVQRAIAAFFASHEISKDCPSTRRTANHLKSELDNPEIF